jgi:hypothetical protein
MKRIDFVWCTAQVVALVACYPLFFSWVPWIASEPISDVPPEVQRLMPQGCPAVFGNHATYSCFWPGSIRAHPIEFSAITVGFAACVGVLIFSAATGRGLSFRWRRTRAAEHGGSDQRGRDV